MSFHPEIDINPSPGYAFAVMKASELNNKAFGIVERNGDLATAEPLLLEAMTINEATHGIDHSTTALAYNALGELYVKMVRLDEAEPYLNKAIEIRNAKGLLFDAAVSRENLAQLYEARGNFVKAKGIRLLGAPDKLACGHYKVWQQIRPFSLFTANTDQSMFVF